MNENEVVEERCFMCCESDVHHSDRWNFELVEEENEDDVERFWLCRTCHGKFDGIESFDRFRTKERELGLYRAAARTQRLILLGAPKSLIQLETMNILCKMLFDKDGNTDGNFLNSIKERLGL